MATLSHDGDFFELGPPRGPRTDGARVRFFDRRDAVRFLRRFVGDALAMQALRRAAASTILPGLLHQRSDHEVCDHLADALASGRLRLIRLERSGGGIARPVGVASSAVPTPAASHQRVGPAAPAAAAPASPGPAVAAGGDRAPLPRTAPWIAFVVLDDQTGEPLPNVSLQLTLADGTSAVHVTDADGAIRLRDLPDGPCTLAGLLDDDRLEVVQFA